MSEKKKPNGDCKQEKLPLVNEGQRDSKEELVEAITTLIRMKEKKNMLYDSACWHHARITRVNAAIDRLKERPWSPVKESRLARLRRTLDVMGQRMKIEYEMFYAFKEELYEIL